MKPRALSLLFLVIATSLLLSACGAPQAVAWPGITPTQDTAYMSYMHSVYAFRASDGNLMWKYPEKSIDAGVYAAPAVSSSLIAVGDYANVLHAINPQTGMPLWQFTEAKARYIASPLITDQLVLAPSTDGYLYALNHQGQLSWKFEADQALWSQPVTDGKTIFQASLGHNLYALNPQNGNKIWVVNLGGAVVSTPHLDEKGIIYVGTLAKEVLAVDSATGKVIWKTDVADGVWSTPVMKDQSIFISNVSGVVYALNAADGKVIWKTDLGGSVTGSGAVMDQGVVFSTEKGDVVMLGLDKGEKVWTKSTGFQLYGNLNRIQNNVLVGVTHNEKLILTLDANGQEAWSYVTPK